VQPAAYLYVAAIDTDGEAALFAPTSLEDWDRREEEKPLTAISLPPALDGGFELPAGKKGMVTVLLLARTTPWKRDEKWLRELFRGLSAQRPVQDARAAVWFENSQVVEGDRERTRSSFQVSKLNDPVMRTQGLLKARLQDEVDFTAAVSFAWTE
jgi:hypothetical protein